MTSSTMNSFNSSASNASTPLATPDVKPSPLTELNHIFNGADQPSIGTTPVIAAAEESRPVTNLHDLMGMPRIGRRG